MSHHTHKLLTEQITVEMSKLAKYEHIVLTTQDGKEINLRKACHVDRHAFCFGQGWYTIYINDDLLGEGFGWGWEQISTQTEMKEFILSFLQTYNHEWDDFKGGELHE